MFFCFSFTKLVKVNSCTVRVARMLTVWPAFLPRRDKSQQQASDSQKTCEGTGLDLLTVNHEKNKSALDLESGFTLWRTGAHSKKVHQNPTRRDIN